MIVFATPPLQHYYVLVLLFDTLIDYAAVRFSETVHCLQAFFIYNYFNS